MKLVAWSLNAPQKKIFFISTMRSFTVVLLSFMTKLCFVQNLQIWIFVKMRAAAKICIHDGLRVLTSSTFGCKKLWNQKNCRGQRVKKNRKAFIRETLPVLQTKPRNYLHECSFFVGKYLQA